MSMVISSRKNPAVLLFRRLNTERKARESEQSFNIEGIRLCMEAVCAGLSVVSAFVTESAAKRYPAEYAELCAYCEPAVITDELGEYISDTKTPQGMFITAKMLDNSRKMSTIEKGRFILLDGLRDSGNVGTIIRTCDAFGISGIVMSPDCADVYSPKVVRGAMGSLFRLPFAVTPLPRFIEKLKADGHKVYAAVLDKNAVEAEKAELNGKCAVIIGNEGNGVSPEVISTAGNSIYIPIENAESLNAAAAAAIFIYKMRNINT